MVTSNSPSLPDRFTLGPWQVDASLDSVSGHGKTHKLEPRTMRLLCVLAQAEGQLVRTDDLLDAVWPQVVVTPGSLYEAVAQLRKILGQDAVVTVPRKGYRLGMLAVQDTPAPVFGVPRAPALGPYSLAVLPLRTRQLAEHHGFIRESLLDDLIAELSRHPQIAVVALGTMLSYDHPRRPAPREVGRELGTAYVVDGLLEMQRDMLTVRLQMVSTAEGNQVWVDSVELALDSWRDTAVIVVGRLARALNLELLGQVARAPAVHGPQMAEAMVLASRAWVDLFSRQETRAVTLQARVWAQQAMALAPDLPMALVCMAFCRWRESQFGWNDAAPQTLREQALALAERAVALDEREPDAHYVLGLTAYSLGETARAEECLRHCIRLSGSHAPAHGLLALVRTRRGYPEEAAALCARAFALSPREPLRVVWHLALAWANLALHDYSGAFDASQQGMAVNPDFATVYVTGAAAAQKLGLEEDARRWVAFLRERTVFNSVQAVRERLSPPRTPDQQARMDTLVSLLAAAGLP